MCTLALFAVNKALLSPRAFVQANSPRRSCQYDRLIALTALSDQSTQPSQANMSMTTGLLL